MGNQTLVPSQIQNVESYFLDIKNYVKYKSSLGSTTFMKTAIVTLNDTYYITNNEQISEQYNNNNNNNYNINNSIHINNNNVINSYNTTPSVPFSNTNNNINNISTTLIVFNNNNITTNNINSVTNNVNNNENVITNAPSAIDEDISNTVKSSPVIANNIDNNNNSDISNTNSNITNNNNNNIGNVVELFQYSNHDNLNEQTMDFYVLNQQKQLRDAQQQLVVKVFPKYDLSIRLDLYGKRVREIKTIIYSRYGQSTNCLPFSNLIITDKAAFLFRQYIKYNLYDRLSTRPFLTDIEKKWITFQLISAVNEIHSLQVIHGDIKLENVLINSFLWVSLTDFASYKPVYLSENHPSADFNYYFDISRRRTCYLAPERFKIPKERQNNFTSTGTLPTSIKDIGEKIGVDELLPPNPNDFKASMDVFSLGCTIAELFMEKQLFDFARLLSYKEGKYDPKIELQNEIADQNILNMILSMINLNTNAVKTVNEYLQEQNDLSFPSYFVFLKSYISKYVSIHLSPDDIIIKLKSELPLLLKNLKLNLDNKLLANETSDVKVPYNSNSDSNSTNDAFLILLSLLLSTVRKLKYSRTKLLAIDLMLNFSKFLNDAIIIDRILPYYLDILTQNTELPIVKSKCIFALNDCLAQINQIDVQNMNIFPELIFDCLEKLSKDESFLVRSTIAKTISNFALISIRYLDTCFLKRRIFIDSNQQIDNKIQQQKLEDITYDKEYQLYQSKVTDIVMHLMTSSQLDSSNAVKETLLRSDISRLCSFFGIQKTCEFLLPHMITILNEKNDWSVRSAFFDALTPVLTNIGWESVDVIKSLLEQGLKDSEEFVIYRTLLTISSMADIGLFDKAQIIYLLESHISPLICHPSLWIRHGACYFISIVCKQIKQKSNDLSKADIICSIIPKLTKYLKRNDLIEFDRIDVLINCLKPPLKRPIYDCVAQDGRSDHLFSFLKQRSDIRSLAKKNHPPAYFDCPDTGIQTLFERLCKLGLNEDDEEKLLAMKDFMDKTRQSRLTSSLHGIDLTVTNASNSQQPFGNIKNKDNFLIKDGCISIINNRSLNSIDLINKQSQFKTTTKHLIGDKSIDQTTNVTELSNDLSNKYDDSPNTYQQQQSSKLNNEWKVMFASSINSTDVNDTDKELKPAIIKRKSNNINHNYNNGFEQSQEEQKFDCSIEFDSYIYRHKLLIDDYNNKQMRQRYLRESVNSSVSSNQICFSLSSSKWRPRGSLIIHSNEHTKEITKLCRNKDSTYFASCSNAESSIKLWSTDNLLDGKSGYFKSKFTYDRFNTLNNEQNSNHLSKPCCITFYDNTYLAILTDDFKFYKIDFNSDKKQYRLYVDSKLFKTGYCDCKKKNNINKFINSSVTNIEKTLFYYINRPNRYALNKCSKCDSIYSDSNSCPTDLLYIDDTSTTWPISCMNTNDYYIGSPVRGLFCYSSNTGYVSCLDMRTRTKVFDLKSDLRKGFVTSMCSDPWYMWLALGTSNGIIDIYDFRFMLPMQRFQHRSRTGISRLSSHPTNKNSVVATYQGNNELAIWNMDSSQITKSQQNQLSTSNSSPNIVKTSPDLTFWGVQSVPPLCHKGISNEYISGLFACTTTGDTLNSSHGALICASTDMKIRYIDLNDPSRDSYIISSPLNLPQSIQKYSSINSDRASGGYATQFSFNNSPVYYEMRQIEGSKVLVESEYQTGQAVNLVSNPTIAGTTPTYIQSTQQTSLTQNSLALTYQSHYMHHQDAITDLIICHKMSNTANQPFLVTSSRDGTLKVWR